MRLKITYSACLKASGRLFDRTAPLLGKTITAIICTWLWSLFAESRKLYGVVLDRPIHLELRYSGARPLKDLKTIKAS